MKLKITPYENKIPKNMSVKEYEKIMDTKTETQVVCAFPVGKDEEVQIQIREYQGKRYIDIRKWYKARFQDEMLPTRKGLSMPIEVLEDLIKGVGRLDKVVKNLERRAK